MPDYKKLYFALFNAITDALEAIDKGCADSAAQTLITAQQSAEELYLSVSRK